MKHQHVLAQILVILSVSACGDDAQDLVSIDTENRFGLSHDDELSSNASSPIEDFDSESSMADSEISVSDETYPMPPNLHMVNPNLYRSARPTAETIGFYKSLGIKTIVSVEEYTLSKTDEDDERKWAESYGLKFLHVPMNPLLRPTLADVKKAVSYLRDPNLQPVVVHCFKGSDRTGITIGAYRIQEDKWTPKQAIAELRKPEYGHAKYLYWWDDILKDIK